MKRFFCLLLTVLLCAGCQALAEPEWRISEPVSAEDLPVALQAGLLEEYPEAESIEVLAWQSPQEPLSLNVREPSGPYAELTTAVKQAGVPLTYFEITSMAKGTTDTMTEPCTQTVDASVTFTAGDARAELPTAAQLGINDSLTVNFLFQGQLSGPSEESESNSRTYWVCVYGDRGTWSARKEQDPAGDPTKEGTWESPAGWVVYAVDQLIQ